MALTVQQVPSTITVAAPPANELRREVSQPWNGVCSSRRKCPANSACTTALVGPLRHRATRRTGLEQNE